MSDMRNLVNVVIPPLPAPLTYKLPLGVEKVVDIGFKVTVPLGKRTAQGYVISKFDRQAGAAAPANGAELKEVEANSHYRLCFTPRQLEFFEWIADYYGQSLANVIDVAIPALAPRRFNKFVTLLDPSAEVSGKTQAAVIKFLSTAPGPVLTTTLSKQVRGSTAALKALLSRKVIAISESESVDNYVATGIVPDWAKTNVQLNDHQKLALDKICAAIDTHSFAPFALHGVTGSGKTEVYIEAITHCIRSGKSALVMVPEIALTPQLIDRFRARLGDNIAILHSALNRRSRWDSWRALLEGRSLVAIGARSGIFAPLQNLGLIIVDEEHESSYKQSDGLRYNARDLALVRGKIEQASVVLGSATPSLETFSNALSGRYELLSLPARHAASPRLGVQVVDLNRVKPWEMPSKNISPQLAEALTQILQRGEQAFLLYNRRGFASYLQCESCEEVLQCPNCSVTLTFHKTRNQLQCHYCSLSVVPSVFCPHCQGNSKKTEIPKLVHRGAGTETVFEEVKSLFPTASIGRLDRDSAVDEAAYRKILNDVRAGQIQVLVGTQMIAKGHDLPGVTLVGIIDCDVGLHMPDFRAGERVFQLLTQAAGRAGRADKPGAVILQTRVPKHPSITMTLNQDFRAFAERELQARKALHYPPFTRILRIVCSASDSESAERTLRQIHQVLSQLTTELKLPVTLLGPTPAPLARIKALYRWHLIIKGKSANHLNKIIQILTPLRAKARKVRLVFDIDPQEMM